MKNYLLTVRDKFGKNLFSNLILLAVVAVCFAVDAVLGAASTVSIAMAAGGSVERNSQIVDGAGWDRKFNIAAAYAALLSNVLWVSGDNSDKIFAWYNSSTAFSGVASNYNNFPVGSVVIDIQADKIFMHDAATTWKSATVS